MHTSAARRDDTHRCYWAAASWPWHQQLADARTVAVDADGGDGAVADLDEKSVASESNGSFGLLLIMWHQRHIGPGKHFYGLVMGRANFRRHYIKQDASRSILQAVFSLLESVLLRLQKVQLHYYVCQQKVFFFVDVQDWYRDEL